MRNLTVRREKRTAACLAVMQVYIADPAGNVKIAGYTCKMAGLLYNGGELTVSIGDGVTTVFVVSGGKLSREYCNDLYRIPAGTEDVVLSGRNHLNIITGNAFRFDGSVGDLTLQNRRRGVGIGALIFTCILMVFTMIGIMAVMLVLTVTSIFRQQEPKDFVIDKLVITLNDGFSEADVFDAPSEFDLGGFSNLYTAVGVSRFYSDGRTLEEFARDVAENDREFEATEVYQSDGLIWFVRRTEQDWGEEYLNYSFCYEIPGEYWIVQFAFEADDLEELESDIFEWAHSVRFTQPAESI